MRVGQTICECLVIAGVALASLSAQAAEPTISASPTVADKKALLAETLRYIDEHKRVPLANEHKNPPACNEVIAAVKQGNVTFLEPEAFDAARKPQAVRDIEKRCPRLDLGGNTEDGVRWVTTRNFSLYLLPLGPPAATPMFYSERPCTRAGQCNNRDAGYALIDPEACVKETLYTLSPDPNYISALARIGVDYFEIVLNAAGPLAGVELTHIPSRRPFPKRYEWFSCGIWPDVVR